VNHRSQFKRTARNDLIIDTYNANPTSMKASLEFFATIPTSLPKMVVIGRDERAGEMADGGAPVFARFLAEQPMGKVIYSGTSCFGKFSFNKTLLRVYDRVEELIERLQKGADNPSLYPVKGIPLGKFREGD